MPRNITTVLSWNPLHNKPLSTLHPRGGRRGGGSPIRAALFLLCHGAISSSTTLASTLLVLASWATHRASRLWPHISMIGGRESNVLTYWHIIQCSTVDDCYDVCRHVVTAAEISNMQSPAIVVVYRWAVWGGGGGGGNRGRWTQVMRALAAMISAKWSSWARGWPLFSFLFFCDKLTNLGWWHSVS